MCLISRQSTNRLIIYVHLSSHPQDTMEWFSSWPTHPLGLPSFPAVTISGLGSGTEKLHKIEIVICMCVMYVLDVCVRCMCGMYVWDICVGWVWCTGLRNKKGFSLWYSYSNFIHSALYRGSFYLSTSSPLDFFIWYLNRCRFDFRKSYRLPKNWSK